MEFSFLFKTKENFILTAYANGKSYRWESGGAFGSEWSIKRWYEGIIKISRENTKWFFFFKTFEVRDSDLPEFNHQNLFGEMTNHEILDKCESLAKTSEKSPFPFIEISSVFKNLQKDFHMEDSLKRIEKGEDGWG